MIRPIKYLFYWVVVLSLSGCIEPYAPEVLSQPTNYLVVDGFINSKGITSIKLSRTRSLQDISAIPGEKRASLYIEQESGGRYPLTERENGAYTSAPLTLLPGKRVRLSIKTENQQAYASDYITVKNTPPIDSVTWRIEPNGVQLYVDTHDDESQTRYYRWDYEETWKFTSAFRSFLMWTSSGIVPRSDNIFDCWGNTKSTTIRVGNTMKLAKDVVADYPLALLNAHDSKLRYRYSILVSQYAVTPEEYAYWEALSKNTERIGSLYDAQPTQLTGNVHNLSNDTEPVIGFVGAQSVTQKRIYINNRDFPSGWRFDTGYACDLGTYPTPFVRNPPPAIVFFSSGEFVPVEGQDGSYKYGTADCIDCRKRGTNVRPAFWQD